MRKISLLLLFSIVISAFCSCSSKNGYVSRTFFAMDTAIEIKIDFGYDDADAVLDECGDILRRLDATLSKTNSDGEVAKINSNEKIEALSDDVTSVIATALYVSEISRGCFDITVGALIDLWNVCGNENRLPKTDELKQQLDNVGYERLTLDGSALKKENNNVLIDLGGIGKGYAADVLVDYLTRAGVQYGIISFGSTIAVFGQKPDGSDFKIAVRNPADTSSVIGYVYMTSGVLSVTGDYERFVEINGKKYHHVLDPRTGYPVENGLHSVVTVCENGAVADALSTALFVMESQDRNDLYSSGKIAFEAVYIGDDGISVTDGMKECFTPVQ